MIYQTGWSQVHISLNGPGDLKVVHGSCLT